MSLVGNPAFQYLQSGSVRKIQVVEAIDHAYVRLTDQRTSYGHALLRCHAGAFERFDGCRVSLLDTGAALLPPVRSRHGRRSVAELAENLKALGEGIHTLALGKMRIRKWLIGTPPVTIHVICERARNGPPDCKLPCQFRWTGGRAYAPGERPTFIADAVTKKILKHYSKPTEPFWLLVYSADSPPRGPDDPDIGAARHALEVSDHPFDSAWYFFPSVHRKNGHVVHLWSSPPHAE